MNRNRRGQWLPTPFGDHVIALDGLAAPASVQRPGDVVGAAVGPVRAAVDRDDQRLQAFAIIDLPDDLGSLLCGQRLIGGSTRLERDMIGDQVGTSRERKSTRLKS